MPLPIFRRVSYPCARLFLLLALVSLLVACGGGSDSHPLMWQGSPPVGLLKDQPEISSDPEPRVHRISTSAGVGGSVNPATTTAVEGEASRLTVNAEPGYSIAAVEGCGGTLNGSSYFTVPITAPCTISASFTLNSHTVATMVRSALGGTTAGDGEFEYGSEVTVTAVPDPGFAFIAWTEGSVLVSTDAEYTFELLSNRSLSASFATATNSTRVAMPPVGRVRVFEAGNAPAGVLFASTVEIAVDDGGTALWRSADGGANWERVADVEATFVSIASGDPDLIIAGHVGGYLLSQDGGVTWTEGTIAAAPGVNVAPAAAAAVNADAGIYMAVAAIAAPGLYRTRDLGASWERIRGPEPSLPISHVQLRHVAVSAGDPAVIHALTGGNLNAWRSVDGGASFFSIRAGIAVDQPQVFGPGLRVDPQNADRVLIENHITLNGGANWTPLILPPRTVEMFDPLGNGPFEVTVAQDQVSPRNTVWFEGNLLRVVDDRLVISPDAGASWSDLLTLVGPVGTFDTERLFLAEDALYLQLNGGPNLVQRVDLQAIRDALAD